MILRIKQDPHNKKEILNNAKKIEETMKNFGIDAYYYSNQ